MGRRRKFNRITLTTIAISVEASDLVSKLKYRRETQDEFIKRLIAEWQDLREYRLDMDMILCLKDKQILKLENELRNLKIKTSVLNIQVLLYFN